MLKGQAQYHSPPDDKWVILSTLMAFNYLRARRDEIAAPFTLLSFRQDDRKMTVKRFLDFFQRYLTKFGHFKAQSNLKQSPMLFEACDICSPVSIIFE